MVQFCKETNRTFQYNFLHVFRILEIKLNGCARIVNVMDTFTDFLICDSPFRCHSSTFRSN